MVGTWHCTGKSMASPMGPEHPAEAEVKVGEDAWTGCGSSATTARRRPRRIPCRSPATNTGPTTRPRRCSTAWSWTAWAASRRATRRGGRGDKLVWTMEGMMGGQKMKSRDTFVRKSQSELSLTGESARPTGSGPRPTRPLARNDGLGEAGVSLFRGALLAGSQSRWLRERATKWRFVRRAVSRFMPGETLDAALDATRKLGVGTVLTRLGENVTNAAEAGEVARHYLDVLESVHREAARRRDLGQADAARPRPLEEECEKNLSALVERARALSNWVWVDMEGTAYTDPTLRALPPGPRRGHDDTGVCVQAYLYRTAEDLKALIAHGGGHPAGQGRVPGAAGQGVPEEERRGRELLQARAAAAVAGGARRRESARSSGRTIRS